MAEGLLTRHGDVRLAVAKDAHELAPRLREDDRRELEEISGRRALDHLLLGTLVSKPALTIRTPEGELYAMMGVVPKGPGKGAIWLAGTPLMEERSVAFLRGSREVLAKLQADTPLLYNVADARNELHLRWLRWLGFTFIRQTTGPNQVPVIEFARIAPYV